MRVIAGVGVFAGALIIGTAALLHENEERHVQQNLERWWIQIDDARANALSRQAAFLRQLIVVSGRALDDLFGPTLLSFQSAITSVALSMTSAAICLTLHGITQRDAPSWFAIFQLVAIATGWWLVLTTKSRMARQFLVLLFFWLPLLMLLAANRDLEFAAVYISAFVIGVLCDFAYVALTRIGIRFLQNATSIAVLVMVTFIYLTFAGAAALWVSPWVYRPYYRWLNRVAVPPDVSFAALLAGATNLPIALSGLAFVTFELLMLLQRSAWPLLDRGLYALQRFKIFENRKFLAGVGAAVISVSLGGEVFLKLLTGLLK